MDQLIVKSHINIAVTIKEKINHWITLYLEYIMIVELDNYAF